MNRNGGNTGIMCFWKCHKLAAVALLAGTGILLATAGYVGAQTQSSRPPAQATQTPAQSHNPSLPPNPPVWQGQFAIALPLAFDD